MTRFNTKLALHMIAAFCVSSAPAVIALSEAPIEKMPFLIVAGSLGAIGSAAIAGKAYLSKAASDQDNPPSTP